MGSRTWIKIYCDKWLAGTLREETLELRGVWIDLLALAGSGKFGDSGEIKFSDNTGFLDAQIADLLSISRQKWAGLKRKLILTNRIMVEKHNIIKVVNWQKYQSEYERTKKYRHEKPENPVADAVEKVQPKVHIEKEIEIREGEVEKEIENKDTTASSSPWILSKIPIEELEYIENQYSDIPDFRHQVEKFEDYWKADKRKLKKPKLALKNWLDIERERQREMASRPGPNSPPSAGLRGKDYYLKGRYGQTVKH